MLKRLLTVLTLTAFACSSEKAAPKPAATPTPSLPPAVDATTPLPEPLPKIAASVNGQPIKLPYVELIATRLLEQAGNQAKDRPFAYRSALQRLIVRELLFEEAVARHLSADSVRVEQAYNEARVGYKDDTKWLEFLARQYMDADTFRAEIRSQQTIAILLAREGEQVTASISDAEAQAYYEAHPEMFDSGERRRARHILLRAPADAPAPQKEGIRVKVVGLRKRIEKGESFSELAKQFSQDQGSAGKGGELDVFSRGQMAPAFEQAAFALAPGQLSEIVETPFGYHLIQLEEILPPQKLAYEGIKDRIKDYMLKQRREQRIQELVGQLWARARIETHL